MKKFNYPNFQPSTGNLTNKIKNDYINYCTRMKILNLDSYKDNKVTSLVASNYEDDKIYFWQLYSILGEKPIHMLIENFYNNIFNDDKNTWFRDEFIETGTINYHVRGQKKFWLDIMGGGPLYTGGELKLHKKHKLVDNIMNEEGANLWMYHMIRALKQMNLCGIEDKRVIKCIHSFLYFFMDKYAVEFDFNYFKNDFSKL